MGKKKFDLTKDMIGDVSIPNVNQVSINNNDKYVNLEKEMQEELVPLTLKVPESVRTQFKLWCVKNDIKMSEAIVSAINMFLDKPEN